MCQVKVRACVIVRIHRAKKNKLYLLDYTTRIDQITLIIYHSFHKEVIVMRLSLKSMTRRLLTLNLFVRLPSRKIFLLAFCRLHVICANEPNFFLNFPFKIINNQICEGQHCSRRNHRDIFGRSEERFPKKFPLKQNKE